jgi:hypothetical protein
MFWFSSRIQKQHVIPVFRGRKRAYIEGCARPRKDRNLSSGAVWEGQSALTLFLRREMSIHCSGMNLDSGLFRVVQCRSSMRAKGREKTGMTLLKVVYNEMQNALLWAFIMCFFLTEMLYIGCAEGAPSSRQGSGRSVVTYQPIRFIKNKKLFV